MRFLFHIDLRLLQLSHFTFCLACVGEVTFFETCSRYRRMLQNASTKSCQWLQANILFLFTWVFSIRVQFKLLISLTCKETINTDGRWPPLSLCAQNKLCFWTPHVRLNLFLCDCVELSEGNSKKLGLYFLFLFSRTSWQSDRKCSFVLSLSAFTIWSKHRCCDIHFVIYKSFHIGVKQPTVLCQQTTRTASL